MVHNALNSVKGVKFFNLGVNIFLAQFSNMSDKEKILCSFPWSFDKSLVLLQDYNGDLQPSDIEINYALF